MCYLIYETLLLHSKMSFIDERWMVEVISMYLTFQMHEDDELNINLKLEEVRYYVLLNLNFAYFLVIWS